MPTLTSSARTVSDSGAMAAAARLGLAARALVYLVIGWLGVQIALGHRTQPANQQGALAGVAGEGDSPFPECSQPFAHWCTRRCRR